MIAAILNGIIQSHFIIHRKIRTKNEINSKNSDEKSSQRKLQHHWRACVFYSTTFDGGPPPFDRRPFAKINPQQQYNALNIPSIAWIGHRQTTIGAQLMGQWISFKNDVMWNQLKLFSIKWLFYVCSWPFSTISYSNTKPEWLNGTEMMWGEFRFRHWSRTNRQRHFLCMNMIGPMPHECRLNALSISLPHARSQKHTHGREGKRWKIIATK